jgi:cobalamin synthase
LYKLKDNLYLAVLIQWLIEALLPAVIKPKEKVIQGMQNLLKDKATAKAFARTALIVGLFSLLANASLRYYFWGIAIINLIFAGIIAYRLYRDPQIQGQS